VASVLPTLENLSEDKHVESLLFPCLDEGSTPSDSTSNLDNQGFIESTHKNVKESTQNECFFLSLLL